MSAGETANIQSSSSHRLTGACTWCFPSQRWQVQIKFEEAFLLHAAGRSSFVVRADEYLIDWQSEVIIGKEELDIASQWRMSNALNSVRNGGPGIHWFQGNQLDGGHG